MMLFLLGVDVMGQNNRVQQPTVIEKANQQRATHIFQLSPDLDRTSEIKMLASNFPELTPMLSQQLIQIYQRYTENYFTNSDNRHGASLQPPTGQQMVKYAHVPVKEVTRQNKNADFDEKATDAKAGYYRSNAANNFGQRTPQMSFEQEIKEALYEANHNASIAGETNYYKSARYLNDLPNYLEAKEAIAQMLDDKRPLSIKDAYYMAESAYGDLPLSYEGYNKIIDANANFIRQWLKENGYSLKDPEALHLGIQKFISDTLFIRNNRVENQSSKVGHFPYYYDYLDYDATSDRRNYFVTKTIGTGSGQCHTLPITYLIFAEALGVEASLAYNPLHSFIRYKNNSGLVLNYETTVDRFLPDQFYLETLPVMAKAKQNKAYINSLSKKQIVATVLYDLAVNFIREHWLADKQFITDCMNTANTHFPNQGYINTTSDYLNKRLYVDALNAKVKEKGIKDLIEIEKYPEVLQAYNNLRLYMEKVSALGIQDFPESEYLQLLAYHDEKGKLQMAKKVNGKSVKSLFFNQ